MHRDRRKIGRGRHPTANLAWSFPSLNVVARTRLGRSGARIQTLRHGTLGGWVRLGDVKNLMCGCSARTPHSQSPCGGLMGRSSEMDKRRLSAGCGDGYALIRLNDSTGAGTLTR